MESKNSGILGLVVDMAVDSPKRMPDPETTEILGIALPLLRLNPFEASATAKLRLALRSLAAKERRKA